MAALPALLGWSGLPTQHSAQFIPTYTPPAGKRPTCALLAGNHSNPKQAVLQEATTMPIVLENAQAGVAQALIPRTEHETSPEKWAVQNQQHGLEQQPPQKAKPGFEPYFVDTIPFSSALTYFRKEYPKFARMLDLMDEIDANRRGEFTLRQNLAVGYLESCQTGDYKRWNYISRIYQNRTALNYSTIPIEFYEVLGEIGRELREKSPKQVDEKILARADEFLQWKEKRERMYEKFRKLDQPLCIQRWLIRSGLVQICLEELLHTNPWAERKGYFHYSNGHTQTFGQVAESSLRIMLIQMEFQEANLPRGAWIDWYGQAGRPKSKLHPEVNPWSAQNFRGERVHVSLDVLKASVVKIMEIVFFSTLFDCEDMLTTYHQLYGIDGREGRDPYVELFYDVLRGLAIHFLERKVTPELRKRGGAEHYTRLVRFLEVTYGLNQKALQASERPKI